MFPVIHKSPDVQPDPTTRKTETPRIPKLALTLDNRTMRRLSLHTNGLLTPSSGPLDIVAIIKKLGFVQLDTIQNVSRAHQLYFVEPQSEISRADAG
jgi:hypothetical protein